MVSTFYKSLQENSAILADMQENEKPLARLDYMERVTPTVEESAILLLDVAQKIHDHNTILFDANLNFDRDLYQALYNHAQDLNLEEKYYMLMFNETGLITENPFLLPKIVS